MKNRLIKKLKNEYDLDFFTILLFIFISLGFLNTYKITIPFILVVISYKMYKVYTNKITTNTFLSMCMYSLVFSLVYFRSIHTIILVITIVFVLTGRSLQIENKSTKISISSIQLELLIFFFFIIILLNNLFHENYFKGVDTFLYLVLYPILFISIKKKHLSIDLNKIIKVFITSVIISLLYLIIVNIFFGDKIYNTNTYFSDYLDLTHVYYGMFLGSVNCFLVYYKTTGQVYFSKKFDLLLYVVFTFFLIYIGARISFFAVLLITILAIYKNSKLAWYKKTGGLIVITCTIVLFSLKMIPRVKDGVESIKNIYNSVQENNRQDLISNSWRNMNERYLLWNYSIEELKSNLFFGLGLRNVKDIISTKIINDGYIYFRPKNSHNQYLHFLLGLGVFGFIYFLFILYKFYKVAPQGIYFLFFFLIIMLTESILVRVKGISLFFIFYFLFSFKKTA